MRLSQEEARARVAKGAAHLDCVVPGWADRIDVGRLEISSSVRCVLGQLSGEGDFDLGLDRVGLKQELGNNTLAWQHGFALTNEDGWGNAPFQLLQDAWIEAIAERVALPVPVESR